MPIREALQASREEDEINLKDLIAISVETALMRVTPPTVIVPTRSGATARSITRFRLPTWITAVSSLEKTCQDLLFSYGVYSTCEPDHPDDWRKWTQDWLESHNIEGKFVVMTEGPSSKHPDRNIRMEIIDLRK